MAPRSALSSARSRARLVPRILVPVLLIVAVGLSALVVTPRHGTSAPDTWTFMVYMNGDNELESFGIEDFLELSSAGSTSDVNIVVQFDRIIGHDWSYGAWNTAKRFLVAKGMTPTAANSTMDLGEVDMGNPATLTAFIDWTVKTYNTSHYVLDIWDHGGSWMGVSWDYTSGSFMDMGELDSALAGAGALNPGLKLDVIAFDACTMGTLEVAYQVMPFARYMVASEMSVPNPGFEYGGPLAALDANPNMPVTEFTDEILSHYSEYYESLAGTPRWDLLNGSYSISVIDLQQIAALSSAVNDLSSELVSGMDLWVNHIKAARAATEDHFGASEHDSPDLQHFAENLAAIVPNATIDLLASRVIAGVQAAVLNETHGTNPLNCTEPVNHTNGISIYFQPLSGTFDSTYVSTGVAFTNATTWDEMLQLYDSEWPVGYPTIMDFGPVGMDVPVELIHVLFSEPMNEDSVWGAIVISPVPTGFPSYFGTNGTFFQFPQGLVPGTTYNITITTDAMDLNGLHLKHNFTWQVTIAPEEIPEFHGATFPVLMVLALLLVAVWRRGPGKAIRK